MVPVRPKLSHLLAPCSVNSVFAWLCNARSLIALHILVTRYLLGHRLLCVAYLYTMKALAAAALGLHFSNIVVMVCEVMLCYVTATLWLRYGCCHGSYVSQERGCHLFDPVGKTGRKIESVVCTIQPSSFHRYLDFASFNSVFHIPKLGIP